MKDSMNLAEEFHALNENRKRFVHLRLCRTALCRLNDYFAEAGPIYYVESVVGTRQTVDADLPADAYQCAAAGKDLCNAEYRYREPITALQDDDLEFPPRVEYAYYAVYNLFCKYVSRRDLDDWLIVNQALAAEEDETKWKILLEEAIEKAHEQSD